MIQFIDIAAQLHESYIWNDKNIVLDIGGYRIAVDDPQYATFVTAWAEEGNKVGEMSTRQSPDAVSKDHLNVGKVEILPRHRGKGIGGAMYRALLDNLAPKWKGISSYTPDRINNRRVPAILQRLGGREVGDYVLVDRNDTLVEEFAGGFAITRGAMKSDA